MPKSGEESIGKK